MKWKQLLEYLVRSDESEVLEETGFLSYHLKDGFAMEVISDRDGKWAFANYFQILDADESWPVTFVFQLDRLPEDPFNLKVEGDIMEMEIPARVYKLLEQ